MRGVQFAAASFLLMAALLISAQNRVLQRVGSHPDRSARRRFGPPL